MVSKIHFLRQDSKFSITPSSTSKNCHDLQSSRYGNSSLEHIRINNNKNSNTNTISNNINRNKIFVQVPYKIGLYNKIEKVLNKNKYKVIPKLQKDLANIIIKKKIVDKTKKTGVVYKFNCSDKKCEKCYVGETKRSLYMRISEHQYDIKNKKKTNVMASHYIETGHEPDFENVIILDQETKHNKRLVSEMIHIHQQKFPLNKKEDTENLHGIYNHLINSLQ